MMEHRIARIEEKKLVGQCMRMSLQQNRTAGLWQGFMPLRAQIIHEAGEFLYSLQRYDPGYFSAFDPATEFDKWAAVKVSSFDHIPEGMQPLVLPAGLYAVFLHKGAQLTAARSFAYIFGTWFPASGYELDERLHFELLGPRYRNNDPESEEEIWIPVRPKVQG